MNLLEGMGHAAADALGAFYGAYGTRPATFAVMLGDGVHVNVSGPKVRIKGKNTIEAWCLITSVRDDYRGGVRAVLSAKVCPEDDPSDCFLFEMRGGQRQDLAELAQQLRAQIKEDIGL